MKSEKFTVRLKEPVAQQVRNTGQNPVDFIRAATMEKLDNNGLSYHQKIANIYDAIGDLEEKYPKIDFSKLKETL